MFYIQLCVVKISKSRYQMSLDIYVDKTTAKMVLLFFILEILA